MIKTFTMQNIGNYYGGLEVSAVDGKYFWCIPDYSGEDDYEIPKSLYDELKKHYESQLTNKVE